MLWRCNGGLSNYSDGKNTRRYEISYPLTYSRSFTAVSPLRNRTLLKWSGRSPCIFSPTERVAMLPIRRVRDVISHGKHT